MDRLLQVVLQKLIRTGTLRLTTARGSTFPLVTRSAFLLLSASSHERLNAVS
jgi:hypothetical protein